MVGRIFLPELQLNKTNASDTEAQYLDLHLSIFKRIFFIQSLISSLTLILTHRFTSYGVYISQLTRFARVPSHATGFNRRN